MNEGEITPIDLDVWFDNHIMQRVKTIEYDESHYYRINVALCYKRHHFRDNEGNRVLFAVFPQWLDAPNLVRPNYDHAVRFLKALENHIREIDPDENVMVSLNLYLSGASGPMLAFHEAYYGPEVEGFPYWHRPNGWFLERQSFNSQTKTYEKERSMFDYKATFPRP